MFICYKIIHTDSYRVCNRNVPGGSQYSHEQTNEVYIQIYNFFSVPTLNVGLKSGTLSKCIATHSVLEEDECEVGSTEAGSAGSLDRLISRSTYFLYGRGSI